MINADGIPTIPETLEKVSLDPMEITGTDFNSPIRLPVHLRLLSLYCTPECSGLPVILNVDQFNSLETVSILMEPLSLNIESDGLYMLGRDIFDKDENTYELLRIVNTFTLN
ncbi:unnamed protein product [Ambrosiozyma monospora]|uniref:Unnamed protein product n=1 Tax=Ambrosiozyma monospora TaxID=43982 RepID=A0ACB5T771_AMBMO|nr:unnamed protein product [Ambrosiozyma monospora]